MQNIVIHDSFYKNHKPQKVTLIKNVIIIMLSLISYESQKEQYKIKILMESQEPFNLLKSCLSDICNSYKKTRCKPSKRFTGY